MFFLLVVVSEASMGDTKRQREPDLLLPLFALVLEFSSAIPTAIFIFLKEPQKSWNYITSIVNVLLKNI